MGARIISFKFEMALQSMLPKQMREEVEKYEVKQTNAKIDKLELVQLLNFYRNKVGRYLLYSLTLARCV